MEMMKESCFRPCSRMAFAFALTFSVKGNKPCVDLDKKDRSDDKAKANANAVCEWTLIVWLQEI